MLLRRRFDPWPLLLRDYVAITSELAERAARGELTAREYNADLRYVRSVYESYTIYTTMGRDRKKLGPEFVQRADHDMRATLTPTR